MSGETRAVVTLVIFAAMVVLVVVRPRRMKEATWTTLSAALMVSFGLVSPREALAIVVEGKDALLFLLALLALATLVGRSGFFEWAAIRCARVAAGDARALFRNTFVLGALVTIVLSLDATAVILTPVVLALVTRLRLPAAPYVVLCAFVANVGSLLLPISNLTNLLFADTFHISFAMFAARMIAPQLVALLGLYLLMRWRFRSELPARFETGPLPASASVVPNHRYFIASIAVLVFVLVGYFVAPLIGLDAYVIAFVGVVPLALVGVATRRVNIATTADVSWDLIPFVIGLFIAVRGIENLGLVDAASQWLTHTQPGSPSRYVAISSATAVASNAMNNLPTALIARSVLGGSHVHQGAVFSALIGADVGPIVMPFGSLATMLVVAIARRNRTEIRIGRLVTFGLLAAPLLVIATTLVLALTYAVVP